MTETSGRPVVVGVDGSASSTQAVRWAAQEAARRDVALLLVNVWSPVPPALPHTAGLVGPYEEAMVQQGHRWLEAATALAEEAAPGVRTSTRQDSGSTAARLIGQSAAADLVVVGSRGLGGFSGLVIGSTAVALATHGHCPVVVVRGPDTEGTPRPDAPVVVGVDGSPTSRAAVAFAFEAASARQVPLVAVHAWSDLPVPAGWDVSDPWPAIEREEDELLGQWLAEGQERHPDVRVERVVARDAPTRALLDHATGAQLVVVGSRGRGGFRGLLLGSTSQALIYHAACPVAVVPPPR